MKITNQFVLLMEVRKEEEYMKKVLKLILFERRLGKLKSQTPSMIKLTSRLKSSSLFSGQVNLRGKPHEIRRILPLKSLEFIYVWSSFNEVVVQFDKNEFNQVMQNEVNKELLNFIERYQAKKVGVRFQYYLDNMETIQLLLDALKCEYHFENEKEVIELLKYLTSEIKESVSTGNSNVKQRMEIELELIKRQKENRKLEF